MKRILPAICVLLAVLIVILGMTTISFSWFEPDIEEGIGLEFKEDTKLRSQECTIATYSGTKGNKITDYKTTEVADANVTLEATSETVTAEDGSESTVYTPVYAYYKTVITNPSDDYDTVVSLFLPSFVPSNGNSSLCVAYPTNSCRTFSEEQTDIHIIRNAYVPNNVATDSNPGQLVVEWFVKCSVGSVTFNPSQVYLMYS
ncbi:MAG: hypothetical protein IJ015_02355 [Ruminococcus sp.]|nr:hypothetical protein [Ruminococcus sp.]